MSHKAMTNKAPCKNCGRLSANAFYDRAQLCLACLMLPEPVGRQMLMPFDVPAYRQKKRRGHQ